MRESPRTRRLRNDLRALEQLRAESTIVEFSVPRAIRGHIPESYLIRFLGRGLWRRSDSEDVLLRDDHEVSIDLGADYPRAMPALSWRTPIFHPNISGNGVVCLGGYSTHWTPSLSLDELCGMLWDMIRYQNFDVESPYNREAAYWAKTQERFRLPLDTRPVRDRVAEVSPSEEAPRKPPVAGPQRGALAATHATVEAEIVDAEVVDPEDPDIIFID